ncbi:MAG: alpha/beta hydrolase [Bacteroidota bacterium]
MRPEWLNPAAYPFKAYWFRASGQSLHYLDEGEGPAIVMLHGLGTWSYLFRNQIKELMADHRCLVPDLPGHGFSNSTQKSLAWQQELKLLGDWIADTVKGNFVLLGHDTGGLWAQHLVDRFAERLDALVLVNSWAWPSAEQKAFRRQRFWYQNALGRWWQARSNQLLISQLKRGGLREANVDYFAQFPDRDSRIALGERIAATRQNLDFQTVPRLHASLPSLIIEGAKDPFRTADSPQRWKQKFPQASYHQEPSGKHYLPESNADFLLQHMRTFLKSIHTPSSNSHA